MNQPLSEIIASVPPAVAIIVLVVLLAATIFSAKRLLPTDYRWETVFKDLLIGNLAERK
jgi:hypothetical protein